jgi:hypothetical protein
VRRLFRAGPELRALGRGKRWLFLRSSARLTDEQRRELAVLLRANHTLPSVDHFYTHRLPAQLAIQSLTRIAAILREALSAKAR